MSDEPSIFDGKGRFVGLPSDAIEALPPERRAIYDRMAAIADELKAAEAAQRSAVDSVRPAIERAEQVRKEAKASQRTFLDEWRSMRHQPPQTARA